MKLDDFNELYYISFIMDLRYINVRQTLKIQFALTVLLPFHKKYYYRFL